MILGGLGYILIPIPLVDEAGRYFQLFARARDGGERIPLYNTGYSMDELKQFIIDRCPQLIDG